MPPLIPLGAGDFLRLLWIHRLHFHTSHHSQLSTYAQLRVVRCLTCQCLSRRCTRACQCRCTNLRGEPQALMMLRPCPLQHLPLQQPPPSRLHQLQQHPQLRKLRHPSMVLPMRRPLPPLQWPASCGHNRRCTQRFTRSFLICWKRARLCHPQFLWALSPTVSLSSTT